MLGAGGWALPGLRSGAAKLGTSEFVSRSVCERLTQFCICFCAVDCALIWRLLVKLTKNVITSINQKIPLGAFSVRGRHTSVQWRTEGGGFVGFKPSSKFRRPSKIVTNSTRLRKLLKIAEFRTPTPQDVRKKRQEKTCKYNYSCVFIALSVVHDVRRTAVSINSVSINLPATICVFNNTQCV